MNKYVKIGDLYFEILEMCDYYNLENKVKPYIHDVFEMLITCTLQRQSWRGIDYITLKQALLIKDEFNKLAKTLFKGVIDNEIN